MPDFVVKRNLYDDLLLWKTKEERKPLILRGARQVGKTTLVKCFSKEYDYFISLNLEKKEDKNLFEENDTLEKIIAFLFFKNNVPLSERQKTVLLFIDEIQNSPKAISLLRYFYEEHNHIHVIAAGSLLESLLDNKISFPVGRVEYLILHPFSFIEFLRASQITNALEALESETFPNYAHDTLSKAFATYMMIGGMPEVVRNYSQYSDLLRIGSIYQDLITGYLDDVEKYAKTNNQVHIIRHVIESAMRRGGDRIKFEGFGESNYKSKDISEVMRMLEKTFLLRLMYPTTSVAKPALENKRKSPKLQLVDTGLLNYFAQVQGDILMADNVDNVFNGKIAEHITGQELTALNKQPLTRNIFWVREKKQSNAEIDYLVFHSNEIHPVEVKLGKTGRLRSLSEYMDMSECQVAVRIYSGLLSIDRAQTMRGKEYTLLNLPFYLIHQIDKYLSLAKSS